MKGEDLMYHSIEFHANQVLARGKFHFKYKDDSRIKTVDLFSHNGYEIYFFEKETANFMVGKKVYSMSPGDMLIYNGGMLHKLHPDRDASYFFENQIDREIGKHLLDLFNQPAGHLIHWDETEKHEIEKLLDQIQMERKREVPGYECMVRAYFTQMLLMIYRKTSQVREHLVESSVSQKEAHVENILKYININKSKTITLDEIANAVYLNKSYICHCFKEVTGLTINRYIAKRRVESAKEMLRMTNKPIGIIAMEVGLSNTSQFSRLFKDHEGFSPYAYRKKHRDATPVK